MQHRTVCNELITAALRGALMSPGCDPTCDGSVFLYRSHQYSKQGFILEVLIRLPCPPKQYMYALLLIKGWLHYDDSSLSNCSTSGSNTDRWQYNCSCKYYCAEHKSRLLLGADVAQQPLCSAPLQQQYCHAEEAISIVDFQIMSFMKYSTVELC